MRRQMLEPIGVATIDLLVCAFIAMVVLNLLRQQDLGQEPKTPPTPEFLKVEMPKNAGITLRLRIGNKWWPDAHRRNVKHSYLQRDKFDEHQYVLTLPKNCGPVTLFAYSISPPPKDYVTLRVSHLSGNPSVPARDQRAELKVENYYRYAYPLRKK